MYLVRTIGDVIPVAPPAAKGIDVPTIALLGLGGVCAIGLGLFVWSRYGRKS